MTKDDLFNEENLVPVEEMQSILGKGSVNVPLINPVLAPMTGIRYIGDATVEWCGTYIKKYLPELGSTKSSGYDLRADIGEYIAIQPADWKMIPTGIKIQLPEGYDAQCRSRSGLAAKHGVFVLNSPGTIDNDYRGEIKVILMNMGINPFVINPGDRIAQLVISEIIHANFNFGDVTDSARGEGGFGSTGVK